MKRLLLSFIICHLSFSVGLADTQRPWTFWYWMYGAVSKPGIKADLQAMKDVGLGGCYLMPIRGTQERPEYEGEAQQLTPAFWQMVDFAMQQADSLGLLLGIHVCDGFALAGGPWITPEESMQKVVWSDTIVTIPAPTATARGVRARQRPQQAVPLPAPATGFDGYYEDIAAFACPVWVALPSPRVAGTIARNEQGVWRATEPGYIQFDFDAPQIVRSVEIVPSGNNVQAQRFLVQASDNGVTFRDLRQLTPPRQGWQNTDQNYTYALPKTTASHFRFCWTPEGTEPGSEDLDAAKWSPVLKVKDIRLSGEPRIDLYEAKNGSVWRIAPPEAPSVLCCDFLSPLPVTPSTTLEPGTYRIIRFGHTSTGHTNATAGGGRGLECDKFSVAAVNKQLDGWFGQFMQRPHASVIKYMHVDSWECGSQNWSRNFADEFRRRRGYDLLPWMPVYAGIPMAAPKGQEGRNCEQVLRDIRQTINDLINDVFFATVKKRAEDYGLLLSSESVAPTMVSDGMEHYRLADLPMGEFWLNSPTHDKPNDMLDAISGAHVYGKPVVQAEGFTEVRGVWNETPASIKPLLDRNFTLGMNRLFFHVFTHNPWTDRRPGMTLDGIGLFFQRDQTWFPEARGLVSYVSRCQDYLQRGRPVVDIAVYTGEEMPRRALTPDRLVPMLPGLFGPERVTSEQHRLANEGQPMEESPVGVRHSAGILDLKDWINPLHGYHYDSMNPDGLNRWLSQLIDPATDDMPHYRVLVVPDNVLVSAATWQKIDSLKQYGIKVITKPLVESTLPGVLPDAVLPEGIAFTHRQKLGTHYYFLSNQTAAVQTFRAKFRVGSRASAVLDPLTGQLLTFHEEREGDYDCVDITLPEYGSVFVMYGYDVLDVRPVNQQFDEAVPIGQKLTWDVTFLENDEHVKTRQLFDWSQSDNDRIRYYSGRARYVTQFNMKKRDLRDSSWHLQLPGLCDVAHVWINGHDMGTVWTAPYRLPLTDKVLRPGRNTLVIEVVNTWHNALRGADAGKPPYEGIWTNAKYRTKGDSLLPAGLIETPQLLREAHH